MFYFDEVWFTLSDYVNSQNHKYSSTKNFHAVHKVPLHDLKVWVWCAIRAWRITRPMFFKNNSKCYVKLILTPFFNQVTIKEKSYGILWKTTQQHTHCEQFYGSIKKSLWSMSHKSRTVASATSRFKFM